MDKSENGTLLLPSAVLQWKLLSLGAVVQWPISIEGRHSVVKSYYIPWIRNFDVQFSLKRNEKTQKMLKKLFEQKNLEISKTLV